MRVISVFLVGVVLCSVSYGQQVPYGHKVTGKGVIINNTVPLPNGIVLDSATNFTVSTNSYGFVYNEMGKLLSDSNLASRTVFVQGPNGQRIFKHQPRRSKYFYNETGRIDSITYAFWVDSVWVPDTMVCHIGYTGDGKIASKVYSTPAGVKWLEKYFFDLAGNPILDSIMTPGTDTCFWDRTFDEQDRLTLTNSGFSSDPLVLYQTVYRYDTSGNVRFTNQYLNHGTLSYGKDCYFTFDESGKLVEQRVNYQYSIDLSWGQYEQILPTYDANDRMLVLDNCTRFAYNANGSLDSLVNTHPIYTVFTGAHLLDAYGNDITLPDYLGFNRFYYHSLVTDVENREGTVATFSLSPNYPNPCNPSTTIEYTIEGIRRQASGFSDVRLVVYDILGRQVAELVNARQMPGTYRVTFDGRKLASGVYLYRLQSGTYQETKTLLLLR